MKFDEICKQLINEAEKKELPLKLIEILYKSGMGFKKIAKELQKIGIKVDPLTVSKHLKKYSDVEIRPMNKTETRIGKPFHGNSPNKIDIPEELLLKYALPVDLGGQGLGYKKIAEILEIEHKIVISPEAVLQKLRKLAAKGYRVGKIDPNLDYADSTIKNSGLKAWDYNRKNKIDKQGGKN